jgi:lauroyl/myristoyl acyltransferase
MTPMMRTRAAQHRRTWAARVPLNAVKLLLLWPDRLRLPRWRSCLTTTGIERFERARATGRPVILATLHFGPTTAALPLLRREGLPAAALIVRDPATRAGFRTALQHVADRVNGLDGVPALIPVADLERAVEFLRVGHVLVLSVDGPRGRHVWSTVDDHALCLSTSVCQMAAMRQAVIVPCLLTAGPLFRVTMHFGEPVPDALVFDYRRHQAACDHLHREFLPVVRAFPEQSYPVLAGALRGPADPGVTVQPDA